MQESLAQEILAKLKSAPQALLVLHRNPDADSMGSAAAMAAFLAERQISYSYFCATPLPPEAAWFGIECGERIEKRRSPIICTFDAGDLQHAGLQPTSVASGSSATFATQTYTIVFDHHSTNTRFGNLNVIDTACASTTELIYRFFQAIHWPIPSRVAGYLMAGLINDTDYFSNPATSAGALQTAAALMNRGASLTALRQLLREQRGVNALKLIGQILSRLRQHPTLGLAVTYLTERDLAQHQVDADDLEGITNILNCLGETKAACLIKSEGGQIRVSMRTTRDDVDLGRLAALVGGGGHQKAAGFRFPGALTVDEKGVRII